MSDHLWVQYLPVNSSFFRIDLRSIEWATDTKSLSLDEVLSSYSQAEKIGTNSTEWGCCPFKDSGKRGNWDL